MSNYLHFCVFYNSLMNVVKQTVTFVHAGFSDNVAHKIFSVKVGQQLNLSANH